MSWEERTYKDMCLITDSGVDLSTPVYPVSTKAITLGGQTLSAFLGAISPTFHMDVLNELRTRFSNYYTRKKYIHDSVITYGTLKAIDIPIKLMKGDVIKVTYGGAMTGYSGITFNFCESISSYAFSFKIAGSAMSWVESGTARAISNSSGLFLASWTGTYAKWTMDGVNTFGLLEILIDIPVQFQTFLRNGVPVADWIGTKDWGELSQVIYSVRSNIDNIFYPIFWRNIGELATSIYHSDRYKTLWTSDYLVGETITRQNDHDELKDKDATNTLASGRTTKRADSPSVSTANPLTDYVSEQIQDDGTGTNILVDNEHNIIDDLTVESRSKDKMLSLGALIGGDPRIATAWENFINKFKAMFIPVLEDDLESSDLT